MEISNTQKKRYGMYRSGFKYIFPSILIYNFVIDIEFVWL